MKLRRLLLAIALVAALPRFSSAQLCAPCVYQGDVDLDGIPASIADLTLLDAYFRHGMIVFSVMPEPQIAGSDVNCDGLALSVADMVQMVRVLVNDSALCCADPLADPPEYIGFPSGSSDFRVAVGDFVRDHDFSRGYVPIIMEQASAAILGFQLKLELEAAGVTIDSISLGSDLADWHASFTDHERSGDIAEAQIFGHYNYQNDEAAPYLLVPHSELARIYVSYDATATLGPHRVRFLFSSCRDNGMTLDDPSHPGFPKQLLVSNRVFENAVDITDSTSVYGGIDTCCIDIFNPNQPARAIDFVGHTLSFPEICCVGDRGDMNGDTFDADPVDLSYLIEAVFNSGPVPTCPAEADLNGDGAPGDPVDLSYLVDFLFSSGPAPLSCNP